MGDMGRPAYEESQYKHWLNLMTPFLVAGNSLSYAITKCGLTEHRTTLYEKLKLNDWFSDRITDLQKIPGELANETFYFLIRKINKKARVGEDLSRDEISILKHFSEKHRSSQAFFVNRREEIQKPAVDYQAVVDKLEEESGWKREQTDYALFTEQLRADQDTKELYKEFIARKTEIEARTNQVATN
jgi:hypothetical protein